MLVGAFSVSFVPEVKPLMVSVSSEGIVSECKDVTVHGGGEASVELIEQVCAAAAWALMAIAQAAAPATANFFMVKLRLNVSYVAKAAWLRCPRELPRTRPVLLATQPRRSATSELAS